MSPEIEAVKEVFFSSGWIIPILGWIVAANSATKRERRKETRTEIDACAKMAYEILDLSRKYYGDGPSESDALFSAKIKFELQRLYIRVERLQKKYAEFDVTNACEELLDSVTGGSFDSKDRPKTPLDSDEILKIESDIHHLIDELEEGYYRKFP